MIELVLYVDRKESYRKYPLHTECPHHYGVGQKHIEKLARKRCPGQCRLGGNYLTVPTSHQ